MKANRFLSHSCAYDVHCQTFANEKSLSLILNLYIREGLSTELLPVAKSYLETKKVKVIRLRELFKKTRKPIRGRPDAFSECLGETLEDCEGSELRREKEFKLALHMTSFEGIQLKRYHMLEEWATDANQSDVAAVYSDLLRIGIRESTEFWRIAARAVANDNIPDI